MSDIYQTLRLLGYGSEPYVEEEEEEVPDIYQTLRLLGYGEQKPEEIIVPTLPAPTQPTDTYSEEEWEAASKRFAYAPDVVQDPLTSEDRPINMGLVSRFFNRALEAAAPFPYDRDVPDAVDRSEVITDAFGQLLGVPLGMLPFAFVTGGYGIPVAAVSKMSKLKSAYAILRNANKFARAGNLAKQAKAVKQANAIFKEIDMTADVITSGGIIGGTKAFKPFRDWMLRFGAGETKWSTSLAKMHEKLPSITARAADLGLRNLGTFSMYGQAKVAYPWQLRTEERLKALSTDAISSVMFSVAGLPTAGFNSFAKGAASKTGVHALETTALMGAGMFGGDVGAWVWDTEHPTWEDRFIHGAALVAFHYARLGLTSKQIQEKTRLALRSMNIDETTINKFTESMGLKLPEGAFDFLASGTRKGTKANMFVNRKNDKDKVDLIAVTKPKKEGGEFIVVYQDVSSGTYKTLRSKTLDGAKDKFFSQYSRLDVKRPKTLEVVKPEGDVRTKSREAKDTATRVRRALAKERTAGAKEVLVEVEGTKENLKIELDSIDKTRNKRVKKGSVDERLGAAHVIEFPTGELTAKRGAKWFIQKTDKGFQAGKLKKDGTIKWYVGKEHTKSRLKDLVSLIKENEKNKTLKEPIKTTKYKAVLGTTRDKRGTTGRKIFGDKLFDTERQALNFGKKNWLSDTALEKMQKKADDTWNAYKENKGFSLYEKWRQRAHKNERDVGLTIKESESLRLEFDPKSEGFIENMSAQSLESYAKALQGERFLAGMQIKGGQWEAGSKTFEGIAVPTTGLDLMSSLSDKWSSSKVFAGKMVLPFTTFLRMTKSKALKALAYKVDMHELERQQIVALGTIFRNEVMEKHGLKKGDFEKLGPYLDSKFEGYKDPALLKKLGKKKISAIQRDFRTFADGIFAEMVRAGVEVRKGSQKEGNKGWESLFAIYEKKNGKLKRVYLDKKKYFKEGGRGKYGKIVFDLIKWSESNVKTRNITKKTVRTADGRDVKIEKVEHYYTEGYVTRVISPDFKKIRIGDNIINYLAEHLVNNDRKYIERGVQMYADMTAGKSISRKESARIREAIHTELLKEATADMRILQDYTNNWVPLGTIFVRTADLPPVLLMEKSASGKGFNVIPVDVKEAIKYKKGDVVNVEGSKYKVAKVLNVYERRFDRILDSYMSSVSQILPTYRHFGRNGVRSKQTQIMLRTAALELQDKNIPKWAENYIKAKVNGAERSLAAKILSPFTAGVANIGLSSPFSGLKNFLLQQFPQNAPTFGYLAFTRGWLRYISDDVMSYIPGSKRKPIYKQIAIKTGALHVGVNEMLQGVSWKFNPGLMRQTERLNRYTTVAIADTFMQSAIEVLAFPKQKSILSRLSVSEQRASHIMRNLFGFSEKELNSIINLARKNKHRNIGIILSEIPEKMRIKALQKAHLTTAGGPTLSTMPAWMSKDWARPLTLFYRTAYQVTNNIIGNVMRPMYVEGNPFPMLKYTAGASITGASLYHLYNLVLGKDMINKFQGVDDEYWQYLMRGEYLGWGSNMFDEYGGLFSSYMPAVIRSATSVYDISSSVVHGKRGVAMGFHEAIRKNVVAYNHALEVIDTHGHKVPMLKELITGRQLRKRKREIGRKTRNFMEEYYSEENIYKDRNDDYLTQKSPFYKMLETSFWGDDDRAKAQAYYSALEFVINEEQRNMVPGQSNRFIIKKEVIGRLKSIISREAPIPDSWKKYNKGERVTKYSLFRSKLGAEYFSEVELMEAIYKYKLTQWTIALRKYNEWDFK